MVERPPQKIPQPIRTMFKPPVVDEPKAHAAGSEHRGGSIIGGHFTFSRRLAQLGTQQARVKQRICAVDQDRLQAMLKMLLVRVNEPHGLRVQSRPAFGFQDSLNLVS